MGYTGKVLAEGQLNNTETAIYTVPASTTAFIKFISIYNTGGGTETVLFRVRPGATSRVFSKTSLATVSSAQVLAVGETLILEAGDTLRAESSSATTVDYVVCGVEET